ncbi:unnamed protein product [Polarella glacialis]|uniref:Uncharacterized protein n=1 Tax=Polarella glacialis TaxID=89957 RepID=A0A813FMN3_POLGL|nr:unnamed protein product [Polarella glacialis]
MSLGPIARLAILGVACLALALASAQDGDVANSWLGVDDECVGDGSCALSALQRHVQTESSSDPTFGTAEPTTKDYVSLDVQDLGNDELQRLIDQAQDQLQLRGAPLVDSSTEEVGEMLGGSAPSDGGSCALRDFSGGPQSAVCFCQLTGNAGCADQKCACPQGCNTKQVAWGSAETVTFKNKARATGCWPSTVLLTSPRNFFSTCSDLKSHCADGAALVIETLLRDSWRMYQTKVGRSSLNQCFHSSKTASVKYLHLQSFCAGGQFHGMPTNNHVVGSCVTMSSEHQAPSLAKQLVAIIQ